MFVELNKSQSVKEAVMKPFWLANPLKPRPPTKLMKQVEDTNLLKNEDNHGPVFADK